jgi:hypothetical protein
VATFALATNVIASPSHPITITVENHIGAPENEFAATGGVVCEEGTVSNGRGKVGPVSMDAAGRWTLDHLIVVRRHAAPSVEAKMRGHCRRRSVQRHLAWRGAGRLRRPSVRPAASRDLGLTYSGATRSESVAALCQFRY